MSLQFAILGLLTYTPMNGYYLKKTFDKSINHFWSANLSQIYRELGALEKNGFVKSEILPQDDRPDKRIYLITEEGKKAFKEWLSDFPETLSTPKRDEFMVRIFFGSKIEKQELLAQFRRFVLQKEEGKRLILGLKEQFESFMNEEGKGTAKAAGPIGKILELPPGFSAENELFYWKFTIKRAVMSLDTSIRWAKECIEEIEKSMEEEGS